MSGIIGGVGSRSGVVGSTEIPGGYETGTWTPVFTDSSGSHSGEYGTADGDYIKIGNLVYIGCRIEMSSSGVSAGSGTDLQIAGLPFVVGARVNAFSVGYAANWGTSKGAPSSGEFQPSTQYLFLKTYKNDAGAIATITQTAPADIGDLSGITGSGCFIIA